MRLSVSAGDRVVLVDDLIATGGTALAGFDLVDRREGARVRGDGVAAFLDGVGKIHAYKDGNKDVSCFTMVDDSSIGADMCRDPPAGTPRVVAAEEAKEAEIAAGGK